MFIVEIEKILGVQILMENNSTSKQSYCWLFLGTHDTLTYADFKRDKKYCVRQCILSFVFGYGCTYICRIKMKKNTVLGNAYCCLSLGTDVLTC